jgi:cytochrome b
VTIDGCWVRTVGEIDAQIDAWCGGTAPRIDYVWTIWGYHVLTDVYNQMVIEDPDGILAGWHARLAAYPPRLKQAILEKHLKSLRYWRHDYHYSHKVKRGDVVFLASLTARLVHDMIQVLFALNETYYAGDGNNMVFVEHFRNVPEGFIEKVHAVLYPGTGDGALEEQYQHLCTLIDETIAFAEDVMQA